GMTNQFEVQLAGSATAKTGDFSTGLFTNTATSTTASAIKSGLRVSSTGTWNGANASNIGLYIASVTGGTNNYDAIFNGGGSVGIGTSTPTGGKLDIVNSGAGYQAGLSLRNYNSFQDQTGISFFSVGSTGGVFESGRITSSSDRAFGAGNTDSGRIAFYTKPNGTGNGVSLVEALTLSSGANVGVGSTTPWARLSIGSSAGG